MWAGPSPPQAHRPPSAKVAERSGVGVVGRALHQGRVSWPQRVLGARPAPSLWDPGSEGRVRRPSHSSPTQDNWDRHPRSGAPGVGPGSVGAALWCRASLNHILVPPPLHALCPQQTPSSSVHTTVCLHGPQRVATTMFQSCLWVVTSLLSLSFLTPPLPEFALYLPRVSRLAELLSKRNRTHA